ncbi:MAG: hypothetical protein FJ272_10275, partial [Planctomycetes bacterium]|nr:hypothetical protein [Planctomycetota bacterium]
MRRSLWAVALSVAVLAALLGLALAQTGAPKSDWAKALVSPAQTDTAKRYGLPVSFENSLGMRFVLVPPGEFSMGSPESEKGRDESEGPTHKTIILKPFYMGVHEVTNGQYLRFLDDSDYKGDGDASAEYLQHVRLGDPMLAAEAQPIVFVSWRNAVRFCEWLTARESKMHRLPTEAEWEYACRAGSQTAFCYGDDSGLAQLGAYAWLRDNANEGTNLVGRKKPNPWGLFDMHGNVWEWCSSAFRPYPYSEVDGREDLEAPGMRVARGGSFVNTAWSVRSASRLELSPTTTLGRMGFRVVCDTKYVEPRPMAVAKARPPKPPPPPTPPPTKPAETPKAAKTPPVNYDEAYVAVAANRERIPHPLSKRTYPTRQRRRNIPVPEGMVYVPAGKFQMGEGQSLHEVYLDAYFIGKYEVTNAEWKAFVDATGHPAPQHWKGGAIPTGRESHPVVYVTWEDAMAYCEWVSRGTGRAVRLPTEAQWEKAARGPEGFLYPWGNTWDASLCNNKARATVAEDPDRGKRVQTTQGPEINTLPVGSFPNG